MRHLVVVPFWGAAPKRGTTLFFEIADPEGALSVIAGLIDRPVGGALGCPVYRRLPRPQERSRAKLLLS
jgi:hypothetical protein